MSFKFSVFSGAVKTDGENYQSLFLAIWLLCLVAGCSKGELHPPSGVPSRLGNGYELYSVGGNTLVHNPGNVQLWRQSIDGKWVLVWSYIGGDLKTFGNTIVFNGGVSDESKGGGHALFAYRPSGKPVEISELVTKDYCETNHVDYAAYRGRYQYLIRSKKDNGLLELIGFNASKMPAPTNAMEIVISIQQIEEWIDEGSSNGIPRKYDGVDYYVANPAAGK